MFVLISYLESKAMHVCVCIRELERMTYVRTCVILNVERIDVSACMPERNVVRFDFCGGTWCRDSVARRSINSNNLFGTFVKGNYQAGRDYCNLYSSTCVCVWRGS